MRIPEQIIKKHFDWCGWREHIHGQPLVVDFSYMSNIKNIKHRKSMIKTEAAHAVIVSFFLKIYICFSCQKNEYKGPSVVYLVKKLIISV